MFSRADWALVFKANDLCQESIRAAGSAALDQMGKN
jgi:hypothetical protein